MLLLLQNPKRLEARSLEKPAGYSEVGPRSGVESGEPGETVPLRSLLAVVSSFTPAAAPCG